MAPLSFFQHCAIYVWINYLDISHNAPTKVFSSCQHCRVLYVFVWVCANICCFLKITAVKREEGFISLRIRANLFIYLGDTSLDVKSEQLDKSANQIKREFTFFTINKRGQWVFPRQIQMHLRQPAAAMYLEIVQCSRNGIATINLCPW